MTQNFLPRSRPNPWGDFMQRLPGSTGSQSYDPRLVDEAPDYVQSSFRTPDQGQQRDSLRSRGYRINGNVATRVQNGIPYQMPVNSLIQTGPGIESEFGNLPPSLLNALLGDSVNMQQAADEQFARNNQQAGGIQGAAQGGADAIARGGQESGNRLQGVMDRLTGMGQRHRDEMDGVLKNVNADYDQAVGRANKGFDAASAQAKRGADFAMSSVSGANTKVDQDLAEAYAIGDEAVAAFQKALTEYKDTTAQDASVVSASIYRNAEAQKKQIEAGTTPDGRMMTVAQRADALSQLSYDTGIQVQSAVTPLFSRFNETKAGLEQVLASFKFNNAGLRTTGAGLRQQGADLAIRAGGVGVQAGQTMAGVEQARLDAARGQVENRLAVADRTLQAQQGEREMAQLVSGMAQAREQIGQAAIIDSARLRIDGLTTTAQLIQQNPRSVVSWFQGLLALYTANQGQAPEPGFRAPRPQGGGQQQNPSPPSSPARMPGSQPDQTGGGFQRTGSAPTVRPQRSNMGPPRNQNRLPGAYEGPGQAPVRTVRTGRGPSVDEGDGGFMSSLPPLRENTRDSYRYPPDEYR